VAFHLALPEGWDHPSLVISLSNLALIWLQHSRMGTVSLAACAHSKFSFHLLTPACPSFGGTWSLGFTAADSEQARDTGTHFIVAQFSLSARWYPLPTVTGTTPRPPATAAASGLAA
jgi:hypothetical protein